MKINTDTTRRIGLIVILGLSVALLDIKLAQAESETESNSGLYVLGQFGLAVISDTKIAAPGTDIELDRLKHKSGFAWGGAVGYKIDYVRLELESMFTYALQDIEAEPNFNVVGNSLMLTMMANVYVDMFNYDFEDIKGKFVPYAGIGAGYAGMLVTQEVSMFDITVKEEAMLNSFGVQGMLGAKYFITENYAIDFKYKLLVVPGSTFETTNKQKWDYSTFAVNTFNVGLSYSF